MKRAAGFAGGAAGGAAVHIGCDYAGVPVYVAPMIEIIAGVGLALAGAKGSAVRAAGTGCAAVGVADAIITTVNHFLAPQQAEIDPQVAQAGTPSAEEIVEQARLLRERERSLSAPTAERLPPGFSNTHIGFAPR